MNKLFSCCLMVFGLCFANVAHATSYDLSFFSGPTGFRLLDATGINSKGDITGWGFNDIGGPDGLFRSSGGSISTFGVASAALTEVNGINDGGQTVGDYYDVGVAIGFDGFERADNLSLAVDSGRPRRFEVGRRLFGASNKNKGSVRLLKWKDPLKRSSFCSLGVHEEHNSSECEEQEDRHPAHDHHREYPPRQIG